MIRALVALALLAACDKGSSASSPTPPPPPTPTPPSLAPPVIVVTKSEITGEGQPVATATQLVTGVIDDWSSTRVTLRLWTRGRSGDPWQPAGSAWDGAIGRNGASAAFGDKPTKREGDGTSPAGIFQLRGAYGYAATPPAATKLPYTPSANLECIDDPASAHYTKIVDASATKRDWKSSERMRLASVHYAWVIDLAHNVSATPGGGSCIFFHVWGRPDEPTDGCTAMAEDKLVALLQQLDPAATPVYVLLPRAAYEAFTTAWDLPPL